MFTGIITDIGVVKSVAVKPEGRHIAITTSYDMKKIDIGASICCSGACLTVVKKGKDWFEADVSEETIKRTTISTWKAGTHVNLERALKMGDELGGHIVTGHVDGMADFIRIKNVHEDHVAVFRVPKGIPAFIAEKGSVTLDGVSFTVNNVKGNEFRINIIPHTWENTSFHFLKIGDKVNLEIDLLARYTARLLEERK